MTDDTKDDERETQTIGKDDVGTMPAEMIGAGDEAQTTGEPAAPVKEGDETSPGDEPPEDETRANDQELVEDPASESEAVVDDHKETTEESDQESVDEGSQSARLPVSAEYDDLVRVLNDLAIGTVGRNEVQEYLRIHGIADVAPPSGGY